MAKAGWAAASAASLLFLLNLSALGAFAYSRYAESRLDKLPDDSAAAAAATAATLAPWSARYAALNGWILVDGGAVDEAAQRYERALSWSPADSLLWTEYAQALARGDVFDERLTLATRRALALAPASPAVRTAVSQMGLSYWRHGQPEVKDLWRQSMRWELDHNRASFLAKLDEYEYRISFCLYHAKELGEEAWCAGVR